MLSMLLRDTVRHVDECGVTVCERGTSGHTSINATRPCVIYCDTRLRASGSGVCRGLVTRNRPTERSDSETSRDACGLTRRDETPQETCRRHSKIALRRGARTWRLYVSRIELVA